MQNGQQSRMAKAITPSNTALNTVIPVLSSTMPHQLGCARFWRASPGMTNGSTAISSMAL